MLRTSQLWRVPSQVWARSGFCVGRSNNDSQQWRTFSTDAESIMSSSMNRMFRSIYFRTLPLRQQAELVGSEEELCQMMEVGARRICAGNLDLIRDDRSMAHLHLSAMALATYSVLMEQLKHHERAMEIVRRGFGASESTPSYQLPVQWMVQFMLLIAPNKLSAASRMMKNMKADFGETFEIEIDFDDLQSSSMKVTRCFYHDFFTRTGAPHLTGIFCAVDRSYFSSISPGRHRALRGTGIRGTNIG